MNVKRSGLIFLVVYLCLIEYSVCQELPVKIFQVRIAPLNVIGDYTGVIKMGLQKRFSTRVALAVDYGLKFPKISAYTHADERKNHRYYKSNLELKYYLKRNPDKRGIYSNTYYSIQGFYIPQRYRKENSWLIKDGQTFQYEASNIRQIVKGASLIIGDEKIHKKYTIDYFMGAGIRRIYVSHQPINEVQKERPQPRGFHTKINDEYQGIFYGPHISLGFKIGYVFGKILK